MKNKQAGIYIAPGRKPWPHETRVAEVLAKAGYYVEFLAEGRLPGADIRLDGIVEYELKSPEYFNSNTLEHTIRKAIRQSPNIIIDTSRMKKVRDYQVRHFLIGQVYKNSRIKRLLMITKRGVIIDIMDLV